MRPMATRKRRVVYLTDAEWADALAQAKRAGVTASSYVAGLIGSRPPVVGTPGPVGPGPDPVGPVGPMIRPITPAPKPSRAPTPNRRRR